MFQEFSLVPQLTVEENLFLGAELTAASSASGPWMQRRVTFSTAWVFPLKPGMRVAYLSRAEQQMVEIAKAFRSEL